MSLLKQIDDKGAVLEWSPYAERASMVALATKDSAGAGFDEYGGELEIHEMDFAATGTCTGAALGSVKATYVNYPFNMCNKCPFDAFARIRCLDLPGVTLARLHTSSSIRIRQTLTRSSPPLIFLSFPLFAITACTL